MSRRSCGDPLDRSIEAAAKRTVHAPDDQPLERTTCLACGQAFGASTREVCLRRRVHAALGEHDLMEEHVQAAIATAVETVSHGSRTRGFEWRHASECGEL